jgi:hypothetical protein
VTQKPLGVRSFYDFIQSNKQNKAEKSSKAKMSNEQEQQKIWRAFAIIHTKVMTKDKQKSSCRLQTPTLGW